jgi:hypothetical protein
MSDYEKNVQTQEWKGECFRIMHNIILITEYINKCLLHIHK